MDVRVVSHRDEVEEALKRAKIAALEAIGSKAAGYAGALAPHDTGRLRNSITWATQESEGRSFSYSDEQGNSFSDKVGTGVQEDTVCVGTNVEYAVYQEMGTSKIHAHPYLKPGVMNHINEYKELAESFMRKA